jgi:hypothetical protein
MSMWVMQDRLLLEVASSSWQDSNISIAWRTWVGIKINF